MDTYEKNRPKIIFDRQSLPFILKALKIKTDIPLDEIGGFYNGKIYRHDLCSIIELSEDIKENEVLARLLL